MTKYEPYTRHECPHCQTTVSFDDVKKTQHTNESGGRSYNLSRFGEKGQILDVVVVQCPSCLKLVVSADKGEGQKNEPSEEYVIWPILSTRSPAPQEVPEHVADDYTEASLVLGISPKASAALSRRCLQIVLVEKGGANKKKNLSEQIVEVLPNLPSHIASNLDAVRNVGNFAAHQQKSVNTGAILDVEPGEAEWNLEILEDLFDFYYVKPVEAQKKREAMNKKLQEAGKPLLKKP